MRRSPPARHRLATLALAAAAISSVACASAERRDGAPQLAAMRAPFAEPLYDHIPADTPYVWITAGLDEAALTELLGLSSAQAGRMLELIDQLARLGITTDDLGEAIDTRTLALLHLLGGSFDARSLEARGFSAPLRGVVYGEGLIPVTRVAISDPAAALAHLGRAFEALGFDVKRHTFHQIPALSAVMSGSAFTLVWVAKPDELIGTVVTDGDLEGTIAPHISDHLEADRRVTPGDIEALRRAHGLPPALIGWLDLGHLLEALLAAGPVGEGLLTEAGLEGVDAPPCQGELSELAPGLPRLVFGLGEGGTQRLAVELPDAELRAGLDALVASRAGLAVEPFDEPSASLSLTADAVAGANLIDLLGRRARARHFKCPPLSKLARDLGEQALELQVSSRLFVTGLRGVHLRAQGGLGDEEEMSYIAALVHDDPLPFLRGLRQILGDLPLPSEANGFPVTVVPEIDGWPLKVAVFGRVAALAHGPLGDIALERTMDKGVGAEMPLFRLWVAGPLLETLARLEGELEADELPATVEALIGAAPSLPPGPKSEGHDALSEARAEVDAERRALLTKLLTLAGDGAGPIESTELRATVDEGVLRFTVEERRSAPARIPLRARTERGWGGLGGPPR